MEIRNVTQFANFLKGNNLSRLDGMLQQLVNCIDNYTVHCNCHKLEDKRKMYDTCNKLYFNTAHNLCPRFKNEFLATTAERQINIYTENGQLIISISR